MHCRPTSLSLALSLKVIPFDIFVLPNHKLEAIGRSRTLLDFGDVADMVARGPATTETNSRFGWKDVDIFAVD